MTNLLKAAGKSSTHTGPVTSVFSRVPNTKVAAPGNKLNLANLPTNTKIALGIGVACVALIAIAVPIVLGGGSAAQDIQELVSEEEDGAGLFPSSLAMMNTATTRPQAVETETGGSTVDVNTVTAELNGVRVESGAAAVGTVHEVKSGETLSSIAQRYFGTASKWTAIADANNIPRSQAGNLRLGQKLNIPAVDGFRGGSTGATTQAAAATPAPAMPNSQRGLLEGLTQPAPATTGFGTGNLNEPQRQPRTRLVSRTVFPGGTHVLRDGDNQFRLAIQYYGQEHLMEAMRIREANPHVDWTEIQPGTRISIPALTVEVEEVVPPVGTTTSVQPSPATTPAASASRTHEVKERETLSSIARQYYGSAAPEHVRRIQEANRITDPTRVRAGQRLVIP